jgi:hypothetical protein
MPPVSDMPHETEESKGGGDEGKRGSPPRKGKGKKGGKAKGSSPARPGRAAPTNPLKVSMWLR